MSTSTRRALEGRDQRIHRRIRCLAYLTQTWKPPQGAEVIVPTTKDGPCFNIVFPDQSKVPVHLIAQHEKHRAKYIARNPSSIIVYYDKARPYRRTGQWLSGQLDCLTGPHDFDRLKPLPHQRRSKHKRRS